MSFPILGLESRLRCALLDREKTASQIEQCLKEIEKLENKLRNGAPARAELEKTMRERGVVIQDVKERMHRVEDTVFEEFCAEIGVDNIRQYEERELRCVLFHILFILLTFCFHWPRANLSSLTFET